MGNPNPLARPTEISLDYDRFQRPLVNDQNGVAVVNSSNEQFDPPVEYDDSRPTLTMTRNELAPPDALAADYKDVCNSDSWYGQAAYTWKCGGIKYQRAYENNVLYWKVTYIFHLNPLGWYERVLDRGSFWIGDDGKTPKKFYASDGTVIPYGLLNGEGKPLGKADSSHPGSVGALIYTIGDTQDSMTTGGDAGYAFPANQSTYPIVLKIENELVQAPSPPSSSNWSGLVRGYGGTTKAAHNVGAVVKMRPYYRVFSPYKQLPFAALRLP